MTETKYRIRISRLSSGDRYVEVTDPETGVTVISVDERDVEKATARCRQVIEEMVRERRQVRGGEDEKT